MRRCLEKNKEERFQSARDLAFALQQLRDSTAGHADRRLRGSSVSGRTASPRRWRGGARAEAAAIRLPAAPARTPAPTFEQLTFRRGRIGGARFASADRPSSTARRARETRSKSGGSILPTARRRARSTIRPGATCSPRGRASLRCRGAAAVSSWRTLRGHAGGRARLAAARPREVREHRRRRLGPVGRGAGGRPLDWRRGRTEPDRISVGHALQATRLDPFLAVLARRSAPRLRGGSGPAAASSGSVLVIGPERHSHRSPTSGKSCAAWRGRRRRRDLVHRRRRAVEPSVARGHARETAPRLEAPGSLTLWDIAPDGRVLLTRDEERRAIVGVAPAKRPNAISPGSTTRAWPTSLTTAGGCCAAIASASTSARRTGRPPSIWLKDGLCRRPLARRQDGPRHESRERQLVRVPYEQPAILSRCRLTASSVQWARVVPGRATRPVHREGGRKADVVPTFKTSRVAPRRPSRRRTRGRCRSHRTENGSQRSARSGDLAVAGGGRRAPNPVPDSQEGDRPVAWSADGQSLWLFRRGGDPAQVFELEIATGRRHSGRPWTHRLRGRVLDHRIPDHAQGGRLLYSYTRLLSQLYLVRGLK